jgi:hypothetical protein
MHTIILSKGTRVKPEPVRNEKILISLQIPLYALRRCHFMSNDTSRHKNQYLQQPPFIVIMIILFCCELIVTNLLLTLHFQFQGAESFLRRWTVVQLLKKLSQFYGTWRFIAMFTRAHNWSPLRVRRIPRIHSHTSSLIRIFALPFHLRLGFTRGLFLLGFTITILYGFLISSMCATCSVNLILLDST